MGEGGARGGLNGGVVLLLDGVTTPLPTLLALCGFLGGLHRLPVYTGLSLEVLPFCPGIIGDAFELFCCH